MSTEINHSYWRLGLEGVVVKVASEWDEGRGKGSTRLEVEVPREGRRPWEPRSDRWVLEVPADQLAAAQALYPPGGESKSGELGKALKDVEYRYVTVEFGPGFLRRSRLSVWLNRLLRQPQELGDVERVAFGPLYKDVHGGNAA
ncbi:hypothetical protein FM076_33090 [Streptomyces albus subsp. chlorinus]|uniref:hypothetical protein n=1 Tax=Streptomyces albus TaxID=1888 RepID=UPI0015700B7C|nr:hypothetical protein [Streptomyces albus]NSC25722.1 hypothetical protein [Streptomyces albus subsp. chlorinus]